MRTARRGTSDTKVTLDDVICVCVCVWVQVFKKNDTERVRAVKRWEVNNKVFQGDASLPLVQQVKIKKNKKLWHVEAKHLCLYNHRNQVTSNNQPLGPLHVCIMDSQGAFKKSPRDHYSILDIVWTRFFYRVWSKCQIKVCQFNNHHLQMNEDSSSESSRVLLAGLHFFRGSDANIDVCVKADPGYSRSLKTRLTVSQTLAEMFWSSPFTIVPKFSESS